MNQDIEDRLPGSVYGGPYGITVGGNEPPAPMLTGDDSHGRRVSAARFAAIGTAVCGRGAGQPPRPGWGGVRAPAPVILSRLGREARRRVRAGPGRLHPDPGVAGVAGRGWDPAASAHPDPACP